MARVGRSKNVTRPILEKFLGLNKNIVGDTGLQYGESGDMSNCYITKDYKLKRIRGYAEIFEALADPIEQTFTGLVAGNTECIVSSGGTFYQVDKDAGTTTAIGTYLGVVSRFFTFDDKLYALTDQEYYVWTGTGNFTTVVGYTPLYRINGVPATGVGDDLEEINILSGSKHMTFDGDNVAVNYQLPETNLDSVDEVYVDGVLQVATTNYTVNLITGVVTFTAPSKPGTGTNNVDIYWTKDTGTRSEFLGNKYEIEFGLENDTRIFVYGDDTNKSRIRFSDLADGLPSAEYFPADHYTDVGNAGEYVKDLIKFQGKLLIFKTNELQSGTLEYVEDAVTGRTELILTTLPLTKVKTIPFNRGQVINGIPVQVGEQLYRVTNTFAKDERNIEPFSDRIDEDLNRVDLNNAVTVDFERDRQYWLAVNSEVWIYSYDINVFSKLDLANNVTCFNLFENELFFAGDCGRVLGFNENLIDFNGVDNDWYWYMNMEDFGVDYRRKSLKRLHISTDPTQDQFVDVDLYTDKDGLIDTERSVDIGHMTFINMNFAYFSFNITYSPKPARLKLNAKKFTYLSIRLNGGNQGKPATVLKITPKIVYGGESK